MFGKIEDEIVGTEEEVRDKLKQLANPNCNKCSGRGFTGWREGQKGKVFTRCKCVDKNLSKKRGK